MPARRAPGIVSETGGKSQFAGLAAAAIVLALLAFGTGLLKRVPDAALGGILLFVALRIIRVKQIVTIYRQSFAEFLLILATAALIIVLPIQQGAALGIILSLLHGIWSTTRARLVRIRPRARHHDLVAGASAHHRRAPARRRRGRPAGAAFLPQRAGLPQRRGEAGQDVDSRTCW